MDIILNKFMATNQLEYQLKLLTDSVNKSLRSVQTQIDGVKTDIKVSVTGSETGVNKVKGNLKSLEKDGQDVGANIGRALTTGIVANFAIDQIKNLGSTINSTIQKSLTTDRALLTLDIVSPKFNQDANQAKKVAQDLAKELKIGLGSSAEALQNLFASGLNLQQSTDLIRRFTNEARLGKSENISLADAVTNLSFAYKTQNSAIGNLSGISENFSDIQERGLKVLQAQGQQIGKTIGTLDEAGKAQAQYAGIIELTNLTLGASEKLNGSLADQQDTLNQLILETQNSIGKALQPAYKALLDAILPVVQATSEFAKNNPQLTATVVIVAAALLSIVAVVGTLAFAVSSFATILPIIATIGGAIASFTAGFGAFFSLLGTAITTGGSIIGIISQIGALILTVVNPVVLIIGAIVAALGLLYLAWTNNFLGIRDIVANVITEITNYFNNFVAANVLLFNIIKDVVQSVFNQVSNNISSEINFWIGLFNGFINGVKNIFSNVGNIGETLVQAIANSIRNAGSTIASAFRSILSNIELPFGVKIPGFAGGVTNLARTQLAEVAERGRELIQYTNGQVELVNTRQTRILPKGTNVYTNSETESILRNQRQASNAQSNSYNTSNQVNNQKYINNYSSNYNQFALSPYLRGLSNI